MDIKVFEQDGQLWTTSLEVAGFPNGYVYVAQAYPGKVKIGQTINPLVRIRCLETQSGHLFEKVALSPVCSNYRQVEKILHAAFNDDRRHGEWFSVEFDEAVIRLGKCNFKPVVTGSRSDDGALIKRIFDPMIKAQAKSEYYNRLSFYRMRKEIERLDSIIERQDRDIAGYKETINTIAGDELL